MQQPVVAQHLAVEAQRQPEEVLSIEERARRRAARKAAKKEAKEARREARAVAGEALPNGREPKED